MTDDVRILNPSFAQFFGEARCTECSKGDRKCVIAEEDDRCIACSGSDSACLFRRVVAVPKVQFAWQTILKQGESLVQQQQPGGDGGGARPHEVHGYEPMSRSIRPQDNSWNTSATFWERHGAKDPRVPFAGYRDRPPSEQSSVPDSHMTRPPSDQSSVVDRKMTTPPPPPQPPMQDSRWKAVTGEKRSSDFLGEPGSNPRAATKPFSASSADDDATEKAAAIVVAAAAAATTTTNTTTTTKNNSNTSTTLASSSSASSSTSPSSCPRRDCPEFDKPLNPSDYKKHMQRHDKPFKCPIADCPRTEGFSSKHDLERHIKSIHRMNGNGGAALSSGDRSWMCQGRNCNKKNKIWPRLDNFKAHCRRMHLGEDPDDLIKRSEIDASIATPRRSN